MEVVIQSIPFEVHIERKRIKNMYLRVKENNQLWISAHPSVVTKQILDFIHSKEKWILEAQLRLNQRKENEKTQEPQGNTIQYFGKQRPFRIVLGAYPALYMEDQEVVLQVKKKSPDTIQRTFEDQAKKVMETICNQLRIRYDHIMDDYRLPHPTITFRKMTSKWGSCMPAKAKITMNINLIYYPMECLEYVLLHEYVHMIVPNHSQRFYDVVQYHMPDYKKYRTILKER